jgi:hypothetical protein
VLRHTVLAQSTFVPQPWPVSQRFAQEPPQSAAVSLPFGTRSVHVGD